MWRVQGFVGRALHRYHGSGTLRLPQNHHVEDEVISGSAALSTSRHSFDNRSQEDDGKRRKKEKTFQFHAELPNYTALDAVGWGAVAVLFMQICRRIHSRFSSGSEPSPSAGTLTAPPSLQKCGYRVLLEILSRRDVLPRGRNVLCLQAVPEGQNQDQSPSQSCNSSGTIDSSLSDHQEELLGKDSLTPEEPHLSSPLQTEINQKRTDNKDEEVSHKERLTEAALNLRSVGDTSVPVILNIIGLESAKRKNDEEAFCCFLASAQHGYNKAQFNTGVCYEKGRGVSKNKEKALHYYKLAAISGHKQAQYRYAKLLLASREHQSTEEVNTAIQLLEEAATAGLTEAQRLRGCLASFYSQHPAKNVCKSIQYLKMAAESGDNSALFLLGQCYESGIEVQQNLKTAVEFYKRAAQAGNKQAKSLLTPHNNSYGDVAMRSIRSAPCFPVADSWRQPLSSLVHHAQSSLLPHSWSTGSLCAPPSLSSTPVHLHPPGTERGVCQWTVGIG